MFGSKSGRHASTDSSILPTTTKHHARAERQPKRGFMSNVKLFFKEFGLDWITILALGAIAFTIDKKVPPKGGQTRYFRYLPNEPASPEMERFSHPFRHQIIGFYISAGLDVGVPAVVIALLELVTRGRSFGGKFMVFARGMLGVFNSVIMCCFIQILFKTFGGGFRPSFLEVCQPVPTGPGAGYDGTWYRSDICTTDRKGRLDWSLESFPSGHVATSWAAGVYLTLYINAKLKVFSDYRSSPLTIIFCLGPMVLATLMGCAISADMSHHWYDIIGGGILGTFVAILSYRNSYVAIFDWRINHIGLSSSKRYLRNPDYEYDQYDSKFGFPIFRSRKATI